MKTKKRGRKFVPYAARVAARLKTLVDAPIMLIAIYCIDGPCKGEVFQMQPDTTVLRIATPQNHFYKMAVYGLTARMTVTGEHMAIFLRGLPR